MDTRPRIVTLAGQVNEGSALSVIMSLLDFDSEDPNRPIEFHINSGGGSIDAGLAIYDVIQHIHAPVYTVCCGLAASMGAFLLSIGEKGHRSAFPHSRILIHQPLVTLQGASAFDLTRLKRRAAALSESRKLLESIIAEACGQPLDVVHADCERDNWMTAEEAKEYGLIDELTLLAKDQ